MHPQAPMFELVVVDYGKVAPLKVVMSATTALIAWKQASYGSFLDQLKAVTDRNPSLGAAVYTATVALLDAVTSSGDVGLATFAEADKSSDFPPLELCDIIHRAAVSALGAVLYMPPRKPS
jgi:hypothetical protein